MHNSSDIESQFLAYSIELKIAEHNAGELSFPELKTELKQIANTFVPYPQSPISASSTLATTIQWPVQPADTPLATASELPIPR